MKIQEVEQKQTFDVEEYPLAAALITLENRTALQALMTFVGNNYSQNTVGMKQLQNVVDETMGITPEWGYRGTKTDRENLEHIISGKPFMLRAKRPRPIRSWTTHPVVAKNFARKDLDNDTLGLVISEHIPKEELIIDLSDEHIHKNMMKLWEYYLDYNNRHVAPVYMQAFQHMDVEHEVIRFVQDKNYTLCKDITAIMFYPQRHDEVLLHTILNMVSQHDQDFYMERMNDGEMIMLECSVGNKLAMIDPDDEFEWDVESLSMTDEWI